MDEERLNLIAKLAMVLVIFLLFFISITIYQVVFFKDYVYTTPFVFASGVIGGCLSIQQRIKTIDVNELKLYTKSLSTLLLFPLTGGVLALLLYVTFLSELIQGNLFPEFYKPDLGEKPTRKMLILFFSKTIPKTGPDFCKLLFWSFVAGFSERFVINFIQNASDTETSKS